MEIFTLQMMYHFNIRVGVSNLSLIRMQWDGVGRHDCWLLIGGRQLLDRAQLAKEQSAFKIIGALILGSRL